LDDDSADGKPHTLRLLAAADLMAEPVIRFNGALRLALGVLGAGLVLDDDGPGLDAEQREAVLRRAAACAPTSRCRARAWVWPSSMTWHGSTAARSNCWTPRWAACAPC